MSESDVFLALCSLKFLFRGLFFFFFPDKVLDFKNQTFSLWFLILCLI